MATPKPTLLAFHGSGSNSTVHSVQLARLMRYLKPNFNVEILDAPFPSAAGPGVLPFFEGCGPYKRWLPPSEVVSKEQMRAGTSSGVMTREVEDVVKAAIGRVRASGGRVVGLLGFSQGTKVVSGLLRASELRREVGMVEEDWCDFRMAICVCSSYPPPLMPQSITARLPEGTNLWQKRITTPVFLAQGKQDEWLWAGQLMIGKYFQQGKGKAEFNEFNMGHHYPVVASDNERISEWLSRMAEKVGADLDAEAGATENVKAEATENVKAEATESVKVDAVAT